MEDGTGSDSSLAQIMIVYTCDRSVRVQNLILDRTELL